MAKTSSIALSLFVTALLLGVLGDALLRSTPWGANVVIWMAALAASLLAIVRAQHIKMTGGGRWLIIPAIVFAAAFALHDSLMLQVGNLCAVLFALALVAFRSRRGQVRIAGVIEYVNAIMLAAIHAMFGALSLVFGDIQWTQLAPGKRSGQFAAIGTGVLIAIPLLIIFGSLFAAADAAFDRLVRDVFNWNIDQIVSHLFTIGAWCWITAGFLRQTFLPPAVPSSNTAASSHLSLSIIEVGIALGALNVLFFAFVLVQFRYFFGGAEAVRSIVGLTYAEYARRGFFELVTVAALVLPLLLSAHHLLRTDNPSAEQTFRVLAGVLIALLFVIMVSAVQRMRLYQAEFGLTELRLYTTAFMGWLAIVFVWFMLTVLRGQRERFVFGALLAGFGMLIGLNVLNPDDFIVRTNTGRVNAPNPFDASYVVALSADAVPALIEALPAMNDQDRCTTAARILARWSPPVQFDWLTWNWSRIQAWWAVNANQAYLQQAACPQPHSRD
jgi:hypothetical protein